MKFDNLRTRGGFFSLMSGIVMGVPGVLAHLPSQHAILWMPHPVVRLKPAVTAVPAALEQRQKTFPIGAGGPSQVHSPPSLTLSGGFFTAW